MKENFKHLSLEQRHLISEGLNKRLNLTEIASSIGTHRTSVAREIQRNRKIQYPSRTQNDKARECIHSSDCVHIRCKGKDGCSDYEAHMCRLLQKAPFVCNGCSRYRSCRGIKYYYSARVADKNYFDNLSDARSGFRATAQELALIDDILDDRVSSKKQSLYHIFAEKEEVLPVKLGTLYSLVNAGLLDTKHINLPKAVTYKRRIKPKVIDPSTQEYKIGRNYNDYLNYIANILPSDVVQMDTVIGKRNEPYALLTLLFEKSNFLIAIKLERNNSLSVRKALILLQKRLGIENYLKLFNIILTDNGSEFKVPSYIEVVDNEGEKFSSVFYCDAYRSNQKGKIENVHRLIRRIIPKGKSLKNYSQEDITLMCNHINSLKRKGMNALSSYEAFVQQYGTQMANLLGSIPIAPTHVCLNESLLLTK